MILKFTLGGLAFIIFFVLTLLSTNQYFENKMYYENLDILLNYEDELDTNLKNDYMALIEKIEKNDPSDIEEAGGICNLTLNN